MSETTNKHLVEANPFGVAVNGSRTITTAVSDVCSAYTTCTGTSGSATLTLGSTTGYSAGNCIFIHYTHSSIANAANVGKWEFNYIKTVDSPTQLTLSSPLTNTYNYTAGNGDNDKSQCCVVQEYSDLTLNSGAIITPSTYLKTDKETGGIIAIKATNIIINAGARIHTDGYGLPGRGGGYHFSQSAAGMGLSGMIGTDVNQANSYYGAGGGGRGDTGPNYGAAGGGGNLHTNYGKGGDGTGSGQGLGSNSDLDTLDATVLQMGPGGGGGSSNFPPGQQEGKGGGDGGGIIVISARSINLTGADTNTITSKGGDGIAGVVDNEPGGGGASGGTVYLRAVNIQLGTNTINCLGGAGGTAQGGFSRVGGYGGAGTVKIEMCRYTGVISAYLTYAYSFSFCGGITSILA